MRLVSTCPFWVYIKKRCYDTISWFLCQIYLLSFNYLYKNAVCAGLCTKTRKQLIIIFIFLLSITYKQLIKSLLSFFICLNYLLISFCIIKILFYFWNCCCVFLTPDCWKFLNIYLKAKFLWRSSEKTQLLKVFFFAVASKIALIYNKFLPIINKPFDFVLFLLIVV